MAFDIDKYIELSTKPGKTSEDVAELISAVSEAINENCEIAKLIELTGNIIGAFSLIYDEKLIDDLLANIHSLSSLAQTDGDKNYVDYLFMIFYLRLGYAPKTVEYALKLIDSDITLPLFKLVALTELTNKALCCGEYEKGREFAHRGIDMLGKFNEKNQNIYGLVVYGNLLCILANLNNKKEFDETQEKINRIIADNPDDTDVKNLGVSIQIDLAGANILSKGCSKRRVATYCKYFQNFVCEELAKTDYFHDINSDVATINKICDEGYYKECAKICRTIVDNNTCFIGHFDEIYAIIEKIHKADSTLFSEEVYNNYLTRYLEVMKTTSAGNTAMMKRMIVEEFKIYDIHSEYESIRAKYETDSLTVCYNRPSFEMNASTFMAEHPEGNLVFLDMDGLKFTNDTYGHNAGDYLLKSFVSTIDAISDNTRDRLYRYAGDEFILLTSRNHVETANFIRRALRKFTKPVKFNKKDIYISFSYGIASFSESVAKEDEDPINSVVRIADKRMYECKKLHKKKAPNKVRL